MFLHSHQDPGSTVREVLQLLEGFAVIGPPRHLGGPDRFASGQLVRCVEDVAQGDV